MTTDDRAPFEVRRGQTYVPCGGEQRHKPFIVEAVIGDKAKVWDPTGGQRMGGFRWVALRNLHATGETATGKPRRTGWRLHCGPPAPGQELCGPCMTWLDRDRFDRTAWGYGHSACKNCMADIKRRYGTV